MTDKEILDAALKIIADRRPVRATETSEADVVRCADRKGTITLDEQRMKMHRAVQDAVTNDERFNAPPKDYVPSTNGSYSYKPRPYVVDLLTPDGKGSHAAIVSTADGRLVRHKFTHDEDTGEVELAAGDPKLTERSTIYCAMAESIDAVRSSAGQDEAAVLAVRSAMPWADADASEEDPLRATWSDEAREAAAESRRKGIKNSGDADHHALESGFHSVSAEHAAKSGSFNNAAEHAERSSIHAGHASEIAEQHKTIENHGSAARAHIDAATAHGSAAEAAKKEHGEKHETYLHHKESQKYHAVEQEAHRQHRQRLMKIAKKGSAATATEPDLDEAVECKDQGVALAVEGTKKWEFGKPMDLQWMPGGLSVVTATWRGRAVEMHLQCSKADAKVIQASFAEHVAASPRRVPFGCVEHREEEKAFEPVRFSWRDDPEPGIYCTHKPTKLGETNVNGRLHTSFSPSFIPDAAFAKSVCDECETQPAKCECGGRGVLRFPEGVRGSAANPAHPVAVSRKSVGSLTNWPAFKDILPVTAKEGEVKDEPEAGKKQTTDTKVITIDSIFAKQAAAEAVIVKHVPSSKLTVDQIFARQGQNGKPAGRS